MSVRKLLSGICGIIVLSTPVARANPQVAEQAVREQVRHAVRSRLHLDAGQFLQVWRDEELEISLARIVARPSWSELIYKVSEEGDEVKEHVVVHHILTDGDPTYTVAINPASGSLYRIRGFADSTAEFNKLMTEANVSVLSPLQAETVAEFYREVNPQRDSLTPLTGLLDLKQAAERQCQSYPFDPNEKDFEAWWKHAKPMYSALPFGQKAVPNGDGYFVEWIVMSSPSRENCGGAPLRVQLEVSSDGHIGKLNFSPIQKPRRVAHP